MNERLQMIVRLSVLGLVTVALGLGMYFLFFRARPSVVPEPGVVTPPVTGGLPSAGGTGGLPVTPGGETPTAPGTPALPVSPIANGGRTSTVTLTTAAVTSPVPMQNGTVAYYDPGDGKFYSIDESGTARALSQAQFPQAESVTFAPGGTQAAVEFPDGTNVVYNFSQGTQSTLPSHWEEFSFSSDGTSIATKSLTADPSARALVVTTADGSSATSIAPLGDNDQSVHVNWSPDGSVLGFSETGPGGSAFGQNSVYLIGRDGTDAGVLIVNGTNFSAIWAPDSQHLIYSVADAGDGYRASLWYADKDGDRAGEPRRQIPLSTLSEKCVFASNAVLYCAVPTEMPAGGGTSPSLISANDNLYKIDLGTLKSTLIATPAVPTQMQNLSVSPALDTLFFTNTSGRLSSLRLR